MHTFEAPSSVCLTKDLASYGQILINKMEYIASVRNRKLMVMTQHADLFVTLQALSTWAIVYGMKWPKQPISMEIRLTIISQKADGHIVYSHTDLPFEL